jgi:hypothetical protein
MESNKDTLEWVLTSEFQEANNALIAHYMGFAIEDAHAMGRTVLFYYRPTYDKGAIAAYEEENGMLSMRHQIDEDFMSQFETVLATNIDNLDYHRDYNLLMEVVDKLETEEKGRYLFVISGISAVVTDNITNISYASYNKKTRGGNLQCAIAKLLREKLK